MNRSILIIICDFLVLSALSLVSDTGVGAAPRGRVVQASAEVARSSYLDQMRTELDKRAQVQQENRELEADKTRLETDKTQLETDKTSLEADKDRLAADKARLEAERLRLEAEMKRIQAILAQARNEANLKTAELEKARSQMTEKELDLERARVRQEVMNIELVQTRSQIVAMGVDLQKTRDDARRAGEQLAARENELKLSMGRMRETELGLAMTSGKLNVTEKELAEAKGSVRKSEQSLFKTEVELGEARTRLENMKALLNDAVSNLSKTQKELSGAKQELSVSLKDREQAKVALAKVEAEAQSDRANLKDTRERLVRAEEQLRSDALTSYAAAAVEVRLELENERLFFNSKIREKIYLPEIVIDGKTYLASTFRALTGTTEIHTGYNRVSRLDFQMRKPDLEGEVIALTGPVLTLNADNRAALVAVEPVGKALEALTYEGLKERGLDGLTLFKFKSFGKETASLDGRCSLNLSGDGQYMYIRNSVRNRSELAAKEGDFVISRQGQFIGMVVAVHSYDFGTREEAQCFIFPGKIDPEDTLALPLGKGEDEEHYSEFVRVLRELQEKASRLNAEYTPQAR